MILAATPLFCLCVPAIAQNAAQNNSNSAAQENTPAQFDMTARRDLAQLDRFLDSHPPVADQLRSKPWLVADDDFLQAHPDLQAYLQAHPGLAQAISQNPVGFVEQEERFDSPDYRRDLAEFDRFLDGHPDIAQQLRSKPWLAGNYDYLQSHPDLRGFLQQHQQLDQTVAQNPVSFMQDEQVFDSGPNGRDDDTRRGSNVADNDSGRRQDTTFDRDRSRDLNRRQNGNVDRDGSRVNHGDLVVFDHFIDRHPEIAEQLRKNPSLIDNRQFVQSHPALQTFLQDHSQLRDSIASNPSAFMHAEQRYDLREDAGGAGQSESLRDRDRDAYNGGNRDANARDRDSDATAFNRNQNGGANRDANASNKDQNGDVDRDRNRVNHGDLVVFDHFMDRHPEIAEQLRKNPSLIDNRQFVQNHPALQNFLQDHSQLTGAISSNPSAFMYAENRYDNAEDRRGDFDRYRGFDRDHVNSFHDFMGQHRNVAREVSENPDRLNDQRYVQQHPALKQYLNSNPGVQQDVASNPQTFVTVAQQVDVNVNVTGTGASNSNSTSGSVSGSNSSKPTSTSTGTTEKTSSGMVGGTSTKGTGSTGTSAGAAGTSSSGTSSGTAGGTSTKGTSSTGTSAGGSTSGSGSGTSTTTKPNN